MRNHPLAEFDLDADADERAVKRAYAKRLKVTRPDEDAAGFQAINEAYREALAYIRWRDTQGDKPSAGLPRARAVSKAAEPAADAQPETRGDDRQQSDAPDSDVSEPPVVIHDPQPVPAALERERQAVVIEDAWEDDEDEFDDDDLDGYVDEPFTFSVLEFMTWIHGAGYRPVAFRERLRAQMDTWPLTAKPAIAHAIITHLMETGEVVQPTLFDVLVEELGLYDVTSNIVDPVRLMQYREELPARYEADIFTQAPAQTLRGKWYQSKIFEVTVIILLCVGGLGAVLGSYLANSAEDPVVPWYRSEHIETGAKITFTPLLSTDRVGLKTLQDSAGAPPERTLEMIDAVIERIKWRTDLGNERLMAFALFSKGDMLDEIDPPRADAVYRELQSLFKRRKDHDLASIVAASYLNVAARDLKAVRFGAALAAYAEIVDLYGEINEGQIARHVLNALLGQAEVLIRQNEHDSARVMLSVFEARLERVNDPVLRALGEAGKKLRARLPRPKP